jgi:DNA-binding MarR family transcriptional regulator
LRREGPITARSGSPSRRERASLDQTGNLLGALALAVADRTSEAIEAEVGLSGSQAAALSALFNFLADPSIDLLGQVLGLTSSGTVRLIDRLEAAGYVRRGPGHDGRTTSIELTAAGRRVGDRVATARAATLGGCLDTLDSRERLELQRLIGKMVGGLVRPPGATKWMCRLCDTGACGRDRGECPVTNAALAL